MKLLNLYGNTRMATNLHRQGHRTDTNHICAKTVTHMPELQVLDNMERTLPLLVSGETFTGQHLEALLIVTV